MSRLARFVLVLVCASAGILANGQEPGGGAQLWKDLDQILPRKGSSIPVNVPSATIDWAAKVAQTEELMVRAGGTPVEPFAMFYLGNFLFEAGRLDEAMALFETVKTQFPSHPLVALPITDQKSVVAQAMEDCASEAGWRKRYPRPPVRTPVLDDKVTATLRFPNGEVKVRFYSNVAPQHVENFLKRVEKGEYDGTRVGQAVQETIVNLGDPMSKGADPEMPPNPNASKGGQPHEFSNLSHTRGVVAMARGAADSSLEQFQVLLKDQPYFDFTQTIFGRVIEGIEVIDAISRMAKDQFQRPAPPVVLERVTIQRE